MDGGWLGIDGRAAVTRIFSIGEDDPFNLGFDPATMALKGVIGGGGAARCAPVGR